MLCNPPENDEDMDRFSNNSVKVLHRVGNGHRLNMMRHLNRWVGEKVREDILVHLEFKVKMEMSEKLYKSVLIWKK